MANHGEAHQVFHTKGVDQRAEDENGDGETPEGGPADPSGLGVGQGEDVFEVAHHGGDGAEGHGGGNER